jgi:hypothetical protein
MIASLFRYDRDANVGPPWNSERAELPPDLVATHNQHFTTSLFLFLSPELPRRHVTTGD